MLNIDDGLAEIILKILDTKLSPDELETELEAVSPQLEISPLWKIRTLYEFRLELIHSLVDRDSIESDQGDDRRMLKIYLEGRHNISSLMSTKLANRISSLHNKLSTKRKSPFSADDFLIEQQAKCSHCKHTFWFEGDPPPEILDPYKPYHWKIYRSELSPEIDHVDPVSLFGTNVRENLTLMCKFCNRGKMDSLGINTHKIKLSKLRLQEPPTEKNMKLLKPLAYYRMQLDNRKCTQCGDEEKPLTIRPLRPELLTTIQNTRTFCYECLDD